MSFEFEKRVEKFASAVTRFLDSRVDTLDLNGAWAANWLRNEVTESNIRFAVEYEVGSDFYAPIGSVFLVTPGTGLTTGIIAFMWAYLSLSEEITVSVSRRDKWLTNFLCILDDSSVKTITRATVCEVKEIIRNSDVLVVYGDDTTCGTYREMFDENKTLNKSVVFYGSKVSIGIHDTTYIEYDDIERYFNDIVVYDGLGCLNTNTLYVKDKNTVIDLFSQIAKKKEEHYRGRKFTNSKEGVTLYRAENKHSRPPIAKGYGSVYVVEYGDDLELIEREWCNDKNLLSSCTYVGERLNQWISILSRIGVSRIAESGRAQYPELTWTHDGKRNLLPFVRLISSET